MKLRTSINIPIGNDLELQKLIDVAVNQEQCNFAGMVRNILKEHLPPALKKAGVNLKG